MSRGVLAVDRVVAVVLGLVLVLAGAAAVLWWSGVARQLWSGTPQALPTGAVERAASTPWWPWAAAGAGLLLVLLSLWWLLAHLPRRGLGHLLLARSGEPGRLVADAGAAASCAAEVLAEAPGVRSVRGTALRDRGELVLQLHATLEPTADLAAVAARSDEVSGQLAQVLGRDDLRARVLLSTAARGRRSPRVS